MNRKIIATTLLGSITGILHAEPGLNNSYTATYSNANTLVDTTISLPHPTSGDVYIDYRPPLTESDFDGRFWLSRSKTTNVTGASFIDFDGDSSVNYFDQEIIIRPPEIDVYLREDLSVTSRVDRIKRTGRAFSNMTYGYFNNDNKVDLISYNNGTLEVAYAGDNAYGNWQNYGSSPAPMNELAFGDFNGDGLTDIFRADSSRREWYVSYGTGNGVRGNWQLIKYDTDYTVEYLLFGSFRTPGKTDIVKMAQGSFFNPNTVNGGFSVHTGPAGDEWEQLILLTWGLPNIGEVRCSNLDNNGLTDLYFPWFSNTAVLQDGREFSSIGAGIDLYDSQDLQHRVKNGDWDCDGRIDSFGLFPSIIQ
jgi:hypothetical protein